MTHDRDPLARIRRAERRARAERNHERRRAGLRPDQSAGTAARNLRQIDEWGDWDLLPRESRRVAAPPARPR